MPGPWDEDERAAQSNVTVTLLSLGMFGAEIRFGTISGPQIFLYLKTTFREWLRSGAGMITSVFQDPSTLRRGSGGSGLACCLLFALESKVSERVDRRRSRGWRRRSWLVRGRDSAGSTELNLGRASRKPSPTAPRLSRLSDAGDRLVASPPLSSKISPERRLKRRRLPFPGEHAGAASHSTRHKPSPSPGQT